jgi:hypothetical protein
MSGVVETPARSSGSVAWALARSFASTPAGLRKNSFAQAAI